MPALTLSAAERRALALHEPGNPLERVRTLATQPAVRRILPWFLGLAAIGGAGLAFGYSATVPATSPVYDGGRVDFGDPIFLRVINAVDVTVDVSPVEPSLGGVFLV